MLKIVMRLKKEVNITVTFQENIKNDRNAVTSIIKFRAVNNYKWTDV